MSITLSIAVLNWLLCILDLFCTMFRRRLSQEMDAGDESASVTLDSFRSNVSSSLIKVATVSAKSRASAFSSNFRPVAEGFFFMEVV
jgi:hypothetical protein